MKAGGPTATGGSAAPPWTGPMGGSGFRQPAPMQGQWQAGGPNAPFGGGGMMGTAPGQQPQPTATSGGQQGGVGFDPFGGL